MNPQVSNAQRKYKNNFKMTTTTGYKVSSNKSNKSTPTTRASDCVDEASDASLYCNQEPLPTPRAAPRPRTNNPTAPTPKPRSVLPPSTSTTTAAQQQQQQHHHQYQHHQPHSTLRDSYKLQENMEPPPSATKTSRSKQRLIKVDLSLLQDDDNCFDDTSLASTSSSVSTTICGGHNIGVCSQPKMPPYPIGGYMMSDTMAASRGLKCSNNNNNMNVNTMYQQPTTTRVTRRTSI